MDGPTNSTTPVRTATRLLLLLLLLLAHLPPARPPPPGLDEVNGRAAGLAIPKKARPSIPSRGCPSTANASRCSARSFGPRKAA